MNKIKILVVIISVFLLVGATGCQTSNTKSTGTSESYTGTEGLNLRFIEGMPPQNVWKNADFEIGIDVQNKGLVGVKEGSVCFGSFSEKVFSKADDCSPLEELKGRLDFPEGEIKSYTWEGYKLIQSYKEDSNYPISAKVCYKGETRANPIVCIKSMSYNTKSVCEGGEIAMENANNGQGAPVAVTSVYEDIIKKGDGVDLRFTITVSNVGGGEIFDANKLKANCNIDRLDKNKINIEAALTGYEPLICGKGIISFGIDGSEGTILCKTAQTILIGEGESYPLPLNIKLNYGYLSSISSEFTIKKDVESEEEGFNVAEGDEFVLNRG